MMRKLAIAIPHSRTLPSEHSF